jgi:hypothetical protein
VLSPSVADFIEMLFYQCLDGSDLLLREALILRQRNDRLKPELRFSVRTLNMNVHSDFFPGEKVKPIRSIAEYGRAHDAASTTRDEW